MENLSRRQFLATAAGVAGTAVLVSLPVLQARGEDNTASTTPIDAGPLSTYGKDGVTDTWAPKSKGAFFLIRDGGRLFAASSICTHRNAQLVLKGDELFCPRHHSEFSFQGTVNDGPAQRSLPRYGISTNAAGHVLVDGNKSFSETEWDDPASFIAVK